MLNFVKFNSRILQSRIIQYTVYALLDLRKIASAGQLFGQPSEQPDEKLLVDSFQSNSQSSVLVKNSTFI